MQYVSTECVTSNKLWTITTVCKYSVPQRWLQSMICYLKHAVKYILSFLNVKTIMTNINQSRTFTPYLLVLAYKTFIHPFFSFTMVHSPEKQKYGPSITDPIHAIVVIHIRLNGIYKTWVQLLCLIKDEKSLRASKYHISNSFPQLALNKKIQSN